MKKNIFIEYDKQVDPPTLKEQRVRDMMLLGSGWVKKDGDFPGHFSDRAPHACVWTCQWNTANGVIAPVDWYPLDRMTSQEIVGEGIDLLSQFPENGYLAGELSPLLSKYFLESIRDPNQWIEGLKKIIRKSRVLYKDYLCVWSMPGNVYAWNYRPGWPGKPPKPAQDHTPPTKFGTQTTDENWESPRRVY